MKNEDIRKMTKQEFETVPENQKQFYQGLVDSGRLMIVTSSLMTDTEESKVRYSADCVMEKSVKIHFMNKQAAVIGIFKRSWQYDILVVRDGLQLVIPKHAIACIEEIQGAS
jgi:sRNA-binding regulator protein Hfq